MLIKRVPVPNSGEAAIILIWNFSIKKFFINSWNIFKKGAKHSFSIPILPPRVYLFYNHIYTRIFRFIGALCVVLTVTVIKKELIILPDFLVWSITIIWGIFIPFFIFMSFFKAGYGIYQIIFNWKQFLIWNSPLEKWTGVMSLALKCFTVGCLVTWGGAGFIAWASAYDELIKETGRPAVMLPLLAKAYNTTLGYTLPAQKLLDVVNSATESVDTKTVTEEIKSVTQMVTECHKLSDDEKK